MVKHSPAKNLITKGRSIVSLFIISTIKWKHVWSHITYNMLHGNVSWPYTLYLVEVRHALYCYDLSNLLHFHRLDVFSPFPKLAIKALFAAVLVELKLPLYHF